MKLLHNVPLHKMKAGIGFGYLALHVFKKGPNWVFSYILIKNIYYLSDFDILPEVSRFMSEVYRTV